MDRFLTTRLSLIGLIVSIFIVAACNPSESEPTKTPDIDRAVAAQTALAGPSATPRPISSATPHAEVEQELAHTVFRMTQAVRTGDAEAYLSYIWHEDPIFLQEQTQWINAIAAAPLEEFDINLTNISEINEDLAYGRMSMSWRNSGASRTAMAGGAIMTVKFHKVAGEDEQWLFGGEAWDIVKLYLDGEQWITVTPGEEPPTDSPEVFRVYYFPDYGPLEGTFSATTPVLTELPMIYDYITEALAYTPQNTIHIKVYDWRDTLRAMTNITLTQIYDRWVQPYESVKLSVDQNSQFPVDPGIVTTEVTKSVLYEIAENDSERLPWWLIEGTGEFIRGEHYRRITEYNNIVEGVVALANVNFQTDPNAASLQDWDQLSSWEAISPAALSIATSQSHIFIAFISEVYGQDIRNQWIKDIASDQALDAATENNFGKSLDELTAEWQDWLNNR